MTGAEPTYRARREVLCPDCDAALEDIGQSFWCVPEDKPVPYSMAIFPDEADYEPERGVHDGV